MFVYFYFQFQWLWFQQHSTDMMKHLNPGEIFESSFEIIAVIGTGGFGTVYKANQLGLNRVVALKILHEEFANNADLTSRFLREAQSLNKMSHANIVGVYGLGVAKNGQPYLVMELVEGKSG